MELPSCLRSTRWQACSHLEAKTERQYLLQLQGLLQYCHPSAVWCQLQGYLGSCWFPWLWIWLWHLQRLTHVPGYTGWIHQAPSTGTTTKWHWGYSILLHRGWHVPPMSAHAKAVLCAIPGQWPARLQLPAVMCQTGCRKPLCYHGKPIPMPLTNSRGDTRESRLNHQGMPHFAQSLPWALWRE